MISNSSRVILIILFLIVFLLPVKIITRQQFIKPVENEDVEPQNSPFEYGECSSVKDKKDNDSKTSQISKEESPLKPDNQSIIISILGTDERLDEQSRSDTLMILKYTPAKNSILLISVPRDSRVNIPDKGMKRINTAYSYKGAKFQVEVLEQLFNIEIPFYIHINFYGFIEIIDILGGVKVNSQKEMIIKNDLQKYLKDDNTEYKSTEIIIPKGEQVLDGQHALAYVRFRNDEEYDFGRIKRQQEVVESIIKSLFNPKNILRVNEIIHSVKNHVDSNIEWINLVLDILPSINFNNISFEAYTLKTVSKKINGKWYEIIDEKDLERLCDMLMTN